jgi:C1A family cysteine protease
MRAGLLIIASILLLSVAVSAFTEREYQSHFTTFVKKFEKRYKHDEFFTKYNVFKTNLEIIEQHNSKPNQSYTLGVNEFADMTFTEFHAKMTGYKHREAPHSRKLRAPPAGFLQSVQVAQELDWRTKNAVTPVKNQGQCGSCWSFSTTGSTEGAHAIKTGNLVSLSEQQLVSCSSSYGNQGCDGGLMDDAFEFIIANGICSEAAYPYVSGGGNVPACTKGCSTVATLSSYHDIPSGVEADMMAAVNLGPVSIAIEADSQAFQFYSGGVFNDPACGTTLDHGVLIVGYGTDAASNSPYWIVKNSWGASWGESGYIRMIRNQNECGLSNAASYPIA